MNPGGPANSCKPLGILGIPRRAGAIAFATKEINGNPLGIHGILVAQDSLDSGSLGNHGQALG